MHKLVKKYTDLVNKGVMTKQEINGMRKALGSSSKLPESDKDTILQAFHSAVSKFGGIKITNDHTAQGLSYLNGLAWTPKGTARAGKSAPFGYRERAILQGFKEFRLVDLEGQWNPYLKQNQGYAQVWRVIDNAGAYFDYAQGAGQWGGIQLV